MNEEILSNTYKGDAFFKYKAPVSLRDVTEKDGFYIYTNIMGTHAATALNYGLFFTARNPFQIVWIAEVHQNAATHADPVTLNIERLSGTEGVDSGDDICVTGFNLKGTADTVVQKEGTDLQNTIIKRGERLALKDAGTLGDLVGVQITIYCKPLGKGHYE